MTSPATNIRPRDPESTVLALPGEVTETSLILPEGLPFDEWEEIGKRLRSAEKSVRWWIGDWLAYGERTYGETYAKAAEVTGYTVGDLKNMASVSKTIESSHRCDDLSWSHHREVASLETPAERERWLDKAVTGDWSKRELRDQLRLTRPHQVAEERIPNCSKCGEPCRVCMGDAKMKKGKK